MDADRIRALVSDSKKLKLLYIEDNESARLSTLKTLEVFF